MDRVLTSRKYRIPTKFDAYPGLPHYFRRFPDAPGNKEWDQNMTEGIKWLQDFVKSR